MKENKTKEVMDRLEKGILDLYSSDKYLEYLKTLSKFHNYSYNNSLLIGLQNPAATHVAGFNSWKKNFNRSVNKGEKGIQIIVPAPHKTTIEKAMKDPNTQKLIIGKDGKPVVEIVEVTKPCFKVAYVFDLLQTSGEPLPTIAEELKANVENFDIFYKSLEKVSSFPIEIIDITSGAKGYCDTEEKKIAIKSGMSEAHTIKTCIHEISHSILHSNSDLAQKDRHTMEVEAEGIAFVVSDHFEIDTSDYSFGYIASWSSGKDLKELKSSLDTIQKTASKLISDIEAAYKELQLSQQNIMDSVIHDNEIDLDREKSKPHILFDQPKVHEKTDKEVVVIPNPELAPVVTFLFSEHSSIENNQKMTLLQADSLMSKLDQEVVELKKEAEEKGEYYPYFKTTFKIVYVMNGELSTYTGRQDIGDGDGGLIDHIKDFGKSELPQFLKHNMMSKDEFDRKSAMYDRLTNYLELHKCLESLKDTSASQLDFIQKNDPQNPDVKGYMNYHNAICVFTENYRYELNYTNCTQLPQFPDKNYYIKKEESIFDSLDNRNPQEAFNNAIKSGLKNPEEYMYMHSADGKDYFKHKDTRQYKEFKIRKPSIKERIDAARKKTKLESIKSVDIIIERGR